MNGPVISKSELMKHIREVLLDKEGLKLELEALKNGRMFIYDADPLRISYKNTVNNNDVFEIIIERANVGNIEGTISVEGGLASIPNVTKTKDVVNKLRAESFQYSNGEEVVNANAIAAHGGRRRNKRTKKARKSRRRTRKHRS